MVALPWSEIDFDLMNLNQAAHGDREFGYIQTRLGLARKTRRRARAVGIEAFQDFADMAGIELLTIDASTDIRAFTREIRLNQAYYRLAQGF